MWLSDHPVLYYTTRTLTEEPGSGPYVQCLNIACNWFILMAVLTGHSFPPVCTASGVHSTQSEDIFSPLTSCHGFIVPKALAPPYLHPVSFLIPQSISLFSQGPVSQVTVWNNCCSNSMTFNCLKDCPTKCKQSQKWGCNKVLGSRVKRKGWVRIALLRVLECVSIDTLCFPCAYQSLS